MKKENFKVFLSLAFIVIMIVFGFVIFGYSWGAKIDWFSQHSVFPDYFRKLFYENHEIFPDFAFHLGSGQNIYNFAYYGFLSPYTIFSYLVPFIKMSDFIILSSIICVTLSSYLMYLLLRKNNCPFNLSYFGSLLFLLALPILFHSHHHLMFVNYFPFLLLALLKVKDYEEHKTSITLIIYIFLMIMTSFYFSVGGILAILLYAWYVITDKKKIFYLLKDISIAILLSSLLIIPVFFTLINDRSSLSIATIFNLLIPDLNVKNILYDTYGLGFTSIVLIITLLSCKIKTKNNVILAISLLVITLIPIFNYILNGGLYVRGKSLIPFIPLFIILVTTFLREKQKFLIKDYSLVVIIIFVLFLFNQLYNPFWYLEVIVSACLLYYFFKSNNYNYLLLLLIIPFIFMLSNNINEDFVQTKKLNSLEQNINIPSTTYRFNNFDDSLNNINRINNLNIYQTSLYSSTYNNDYKYFTDNISYNAFPYRNLFTTSNSNNIMFQTLMGVKWLYSSSDVPLGYDKIDDNLYQNNNVLPLGYVNKNYLDMETFNTLSEEEKTLALINYVVTPNSKNINYQEQIETIYEQIEEIEVSKYSIVNLKEEYQNKIIFISFDTLDYSCDDGDLEITINDTKNVLTCKEWRYYNENKRFNYVLSSNENIKNITFTTNKDLVKIANINVSILDYSAIENITNNIDYFNISYMKNDKIKGNINVTNDGYFNLSIPYDDNFIVKVNDKKINYEKTNVSFIGFYLEKGTYDIEIEYVAKGKNIGFILSLSGLVLLIINYIYFKRKRVS